MSPRGDLTRSAVLAILGAEGPMSRAALARRLEVSPATMTATTRELMSRGVVHEVEQASSGGGRPAQLLAVTGEAGRAIGVKVAPDHLVVVETGLDGTVRDSWRGEFDAYAPDSAATLLHLLAGAVDSYRSGEGPLLGVGVAVPGAVDDQASGVVDAPTLGWQRLALGAQLRHRLDLPVLLENDVNAVTVAERIYGLGRDHRDFVVVSVGSGVGAGLVVDGSLHRGASGGAGEFGHVPVQPDGPPCACGNRGCLEACVGEAALLTDARAKRLVGRNGTVADLRAKANRGSASARSVFERAGETLGCAVAGLVNVMDPSVVVVLGEGTEDWAHWQVGFEPAFRGHLMPARRSVPVDVETWDDDSWALGAAALVLAAPYDVTGTAGRQGALVRALLSGKTPTR